MAGRGLDPGLHRSSLTSTMDAVDHRSRSPAVTHPPDKTCAVCGRTISWRAKWARDWEQVRYCSDRCRRETSAGRHEREELVAAVRHRLARCPAGSTVCPSEVAREVHAARGGRVDEDGQGWRKLMEPVRRAARILVAEGECEITQAGQVVDPSTARGPIRLRPTG